MTTALSLRKKAANRAKACDKAWLRNRSKPLNHIAEPGHTANTPYSGTLTWPPESPNHDLGADYFTRRLDPGREPRRLIARLEALGRRVTLEDSAA